MKSARFSRVVETCGKPEVHLLLADPKKDRAFQRMLKDRRVMMIHQETIGTKADYGEVGYKRGAGQILVFPKSLKSFDRCRIVGVNFDLVQEPDVSASELYVPRLPPKPKKKAVPQTAQVEDEPIEVSPKPTTSEPVSLAKIRDKIREAMAKLDEGKAVQAYRVLEKLANDLEE